MRLPTPALWIVTAVAMFAVPLAVELSRSGGYEATIKLFPEEKVGFARPTDVRYARHLLGTPSAHLVLRQQATKSAVPSSPNAVRLFRSVGWTDSGRRRWSTVSASVVAPTAGQASASALNAMLAIEYASEIDLIAHLRKRLKHLRGHSGVRTELRHFMKHPQARYAIQRGPTVVHSGSGSVDRLIARLPGRAQERPLPWAAAFAGLLLTATLWLATRARLPATLARSRSPRGLDVSTRRSP